MLRLPQTRLILRRPVTVPRPRRTHNSAKTPSQPPSQAANSAKSSTPATPPSIWKRMGPITVAFDGYAKSQRKRPYVTQVISALVIYLCGDISAQNMSGADYDPMRTARTLLIGAVAAIPQFKWFIFLSKNFNYSSRVFSLAVKVIFNQFTFAACFSSYFFGCQALLSGESLQNTVDRLKRTVPQAWKNSWKVWPAATAIALAFIPLEYRALFTGVVAIGWQTYLSWMNRRAELAEAEASSHEQPLASAVVQAIAA